MFILSKLSVEKVTHKPGLERNVEIKHVFLLVEKYENLLHFFGSVSISVQRNGVLHYPLPSQALWEGRSYRRSSSCHGQFDREGFINNQLQ